MGWGSSHTQLLWDGPGTVGHQEQSPQLACVPPWSQRVGPKQEVMSQNTPPVLLNNILGLEVLVRVWTPYPSPYALAHVQTFKPYYRTTLSTIKKVTLARTNYQVKAECVNWLIRNNRILQFIMTSFVLNVNDSCIDAV